jgi:hypothetical protein
MAVRGRSRITGPELNCGGQDDAFASSAEVSELRRAVVEQWLANHYEHCGHRLLPWPHEGLCHWPLPDAIARLSPKEVCQLVLEASEGSSGLHR